MLLLRTELPTHTILYFMMMNKTEIFRKIGGILAELNEQYQYIAENPENFNELELELFLANADFLSEHTKILMKLIAARPDKPSVSQPVIEDKPADIQKPQPTLFAAQQVRENPMETSPADGTKNEDDKEVVKLPFEVTPPPYPHIDEVTAAPEVINRMPEENPAAEPEVKQPQEALPVSEVKSTPETQHIPEVESFPEIKPAFETKPAHEAEQPAMRRDPVPASVPVPTLNDLISGQQNRQQSVGGQYTHKPVSDLKSIINLNDKLLFIKDLFNGYSLAYSEAIEILNRFDSFEAAEHFLQSNYAVKNNWASRQSSADKLYELLRRRFS